MKRASLFASSALAVFGGPIGCTGGKVGDCSVNPGDPDKSDTRTPPCVDGRLWANSGGSDTYCFAYRNHACQEHPVESPWRLAPHTFERYSRTVSAGDARDAFRFAARMSSLSRRMTANTRSG